MEQPETIFKKKVIEFLKFLPKTWFLKTQELAIKGVPDILACVNGTFVAMELKVEARLDKLQLYNLNRIQECKGYSVEVTPKNWKEVKKVLRTFLIDNHKGEWT